MILRIFFYSQFLVFFAIFYASSSISADRRSPWEGPKYMKFVSNATEFPVKDYYDYIIVGGGTTGCPLAATLSSHYRVLVLERGGVPYGNSNLMSQEGFLMTLMDEAYSRDSPVQAFTSEEGVPNARGRILGGSSAINAGFYSRADRAFFHRSHLNWDLTMVNQSYEWVEKKIVFKPNLKNWQSVVRDGMVEAGINPYNGFTLDHLVGTKIGGSTFDEMGRRHSAADLLSYATPFNIQVAVYATVERILLTSTGQFGRAAVGVLYRDQRGAYHHAILCARGEVLLSAGAIGSPQLLLLSGIGSRPYLSSWGIPVAHHLPFVGHNLYDNPRNGISILAPMPLEQSLIQVAGITESGSYLEAASNVIPFTSPPRSFFIKTPSAPVYLTVATLMEKIAGPVSFGSMRLASTDVRTNPVVRFNYFSNTVDLERCVNGMRKIGEVLRSRSMESFKFRDRSGRREFRFVGPVYPADEGRLREFCRESVSTIWHYHGGCVTGKVVERNYKVIGMKALRVVDGSTFGVSPGTNPQATLMMLGRYVGLQIINQRRSSATTT
ncbi:(R)-mandelonitrile lyase-like [Cucurbita maxima]|uniref:(R)-mandelonitrile lyase-like n=1 Tax=Cucurbita maxima TaxID=3661 RepID=A0A6J1KJ63_CUCMA|nr:(R)-mandelonitrile lyase-like [Cucurbita maxima]